MTDGAALAGHKEQVPGEFDGVAHRYDLLCRLNPGYEKHLRWSVQRMAAKPGARILDLCCGTGLSTAAIIAAHPDAEVTALDASAGMLAEARRKPRLARVRFIAGNAMDPAASGAAGPYDAIFMAYGIRNMPDPDLCLLRLRELLRPGGVLCCHEYSVAHSRYATALWRTVASAIIVPAGAVACGDASIFRYLKASVLGFDGAPAFQERLRRNGFTGVSAATMDFWQRGIVWSFIGERAA